MSGTSGNLVKSLYAQPAPEGFTIYVDFASGFVSSSQNFDEVLDAINSPTSDIDSFWDKFLEGIELGDIPAEPSPIQVMSALVEETTQEYETYSCDIKELGEKLDVLEVKVENAQRRSLNFDNFAARVQSAIQKPKIRLHARGTKKSN